MSVDLLCRLLRDVVGVFLVVREREWGVAQFAVHKDTVVAPATLLLCYILCSVLTIDLL